MHTEVEFIGVAIRNLLAHGFEAVLLGVEISGAELVIFFLLEQTEAETILGLRSLLVRHALDGVA
jgi:hypothetical protein